jgi:polyisoprenoid-binding protein YceI
MIERHRLNSWHFIWLYQTVMAIQHAWRVDPSQSKIAFKASYMLLGVITGEFRHYSGTVLTDDTFDELKVTVIVDVESMTTFHPQRDAGMLSPALFDAGNFPVIKFVSSSCRRVSTGGLFELSGLLTICERTVPLMMMVSLASYSVGGGTSVAGRLGAAGAMGPTDGSDPASSAVFTFSGMLRRSAFGLGGKDTPDQDSVADLVEFSGEATIRRSVGEEKGV